MNPSHRLGVLLLISSLTLLSSFAPRDANQFVDGFRSLRHWKNDLEQQLRSYLSQRGTLEEILKTSIYSNSELGPPSLDTLAGNVRFSDLIVPSGSLIFGDVNVAPAVRIMTDKTRGYVDSKMNELHQIENHLHRLRLQLANQTLIYKGSPHKPPRFEPTSLRGTILFQQFLYGRRIQSHQTDVKYINYTDVDDVLTSTYMEDPKYAPTDSQSRLFFEGRKAFWTTNFARNLKSGCCDRLKPLHTSRMMTRSSNQEILAPVLLGPQGLIGEPPVFIRQLNCNQLNNRNLALRPIGAGQRPNDLVLVPSPAENSISLDNLIDIRLQSAFETSLSKTLVFRGPFIVDDAYLASPYEDDRLVFGLMSSPRKHFDLSHQMYLTKYGSRLNGTSSFIQRIPGSVRIKASSQFFSDINATIVNDVRNFHTFIRHQVARLDRPTKIMGTVRFDALPASLNPPAPTLPPQKVPMIQVNGPLEVGLVNGMHLPEDIIHLGNAPNALKPGDLIRVRGPQRFTNRLVFLDALEVKQRVSSLVLPGGVIPLHSDDSIGSVGFSQLHFVEGITAEALTIHNGRLDDLVLRDIDNDAQNLIMSSVYTRQPDGTYVIRAPLRVANLKLNQDYRNPNSGLLNGFRPQDLLEFSQQPLEALPGSKVFLAPVEANECLFGDINNLANWPNQLIRIDRPDVWQTVHTRLTFVSRAYRQSPVNQPNVSSVYQLPPNRVHVEQLQVEFYPNSNPSNYLNNINFSPEFYIVHQALARGIAKSTDERYRVTEGVRLMTNTSKVNGIFLGDIVRTDEPVRFGGQFTLVGKVDIKDTLRAGRIVSSYPFDSMDLIQFDKYRIPTNDLRAPIRLNNLVLGINNRASFTHCQMLNGISFSEFADSIMSLTRHQEITCPIAFEAPVNFEGFVKTGSSLNNVGDFRQLASRMAEAKYSFEDGLQCNTVVIKV